MKLEGVDDVFSFLSQDSLYVKIFTPLVSKAESLGEAVHNYTISKNYSYQLLKIKVEQPFAIDQFISDLQMHFNQHPYFAQRKQMEQGARAREKEVLETELKGIDTYADLLNQQGHSMVTQEKYLDLLAEKRKLIARLHQVEEAEIEANEVLFVIDYITTNSVLIKEESSITKTIVKDIVKIVILFFVLGLIVDFVMYYKRRM